METKLRFLDEVLAGPDGSLCSSLAAQLLAARINTHMLMHKYMRECIHMHTESHRCRLMEAHALTSFQEGYFTLAGVRHLFRGTCNYAVYRITFLYLFSRRKCLFSCSNNNCALLNNKVLHCMFIQSVTPRCLWRVGTVARVVLYDIRGQ